MKRMFAFPLLLIVGLVFVTPETHAQQKEKKKTLSSAGHKVLIRPGLASAQQADFPEEKEPALVSKATKINLKDLRILDRREVTLPNLEGKFRLFKVLNSKTGESRRLALDASNAVVDYEELLRKDRALHYQKYGNLQTELYHFVEYGDKRTIPVLIKLNLPEKRIDKSKLPPGRELEAAAQNARRMGIQFERQAVEMFRATLREFKLAVPEQIVQSGPFLSTRLSTDAIRKLSKDPRVGFIGLHEEQEIPDYPTIPESLPTTRTNIVHGFGIKGAGVKIAVLEGGTTTKPVSCFNIGAIQDTGAGTNSHMTKSVAIIGNRYSDGTCTGSWQGYAPEATVLIANQGNYPERYEWAKAQGVNVITMSWHYTSEETDGGLHQRDVYFDYATTHYPWPTAFTSAGNQADETDGAYASGKGYNFFGVGNILNDGDGNRCNDTISPSSSWKNPTSTHGDREVPEIASPGSRHALLGTSFGGTSAATPVTASIATLLMSANTRLKIWPEAIRATLLATANYQNADGANWSLYSDGKDGTGMTNTLYGYYTAKRRETTSNPQFRAHDYGAINAAKFSGGFFDKTWKAYTLTTNSRIRVALTWNSKTDGTSSMLDADLDLWVYDPDGSLVALSLTWDSNYEFVEFTPKKAGAYTIKIRGYSVPSNFWSYYGIAWTTHYDLCLPLFPYAVFPELRLAIQ